MDTVDCAYPLFCDAGTCKEPKYAQLGETCDFEGRLCTEKDGLVCSFSRSVCVKYKTVGVGEGCGPEDGDGMNECRRPSSCVGNDDVYRCAPPLPEGSPCTNLRSCGTNTCAHGVCSMPRPDLCETKSNPTSTTALLVGQDKAAPNLPSGADLLSPRAVRELVRHRAGVPLP
jgi:hypothetical protein